MLAVLTTDADVDPVTLRSALQSAVAGSFNELSVDGCTSTNDTVIVLASGRAAKTDAGALAAALTEACGDLADQMAADAEGATKLARILVTGATNDAEARTAARKVAESQLVQCSLYGGDPYWGRIVSELGTADVAFDPDRVTISYGDVTVCRDGIAAPHDGAAARAHLAGRNITVTADLGLGGGRARITTTDLSPEYIAENMRTS
jgi:glutamate N-acetyltransferase/amino-acid N-acetyltransferase